MQVSSWANSSINDSYTTVAITLIASVRALATSAVNARYVKFKTSRSVVNDIKLFLEEI